MRKLLFLLVLLGLPGCVVFESQTIVWRHDAVRDELRMLMIFEGIFSEGRGETPRPIHQPSSWRTKRRLSSDSVFIARAPRSDAPRA